MSLQITKLIIHLPVTEELSELRSMKALMEKGVSRYDALKATVDSGRGKRIKIPKRQYDETEEDEEEESQSLLKKPRLMVCNHHLICHCLKSYTCILLNNYH